MDASVTLAWAFGDEAEEYSDSVLETLIHRDATVPGIWVLEVTNVLALGERRGRLTPAASARFVGLLESLPIRVEPMPIGIGYMVSLARETGLSSYDAAYLELAASRGVPLATRNAALKEAATRRGLLTFQPDQTSPGPDPAR